MKDFGTFALKLLIAAVTIIGGIMLVGMGLMIAVRVFQAIF